MDKKKQQLRPIAQLPKAAREGCLKCKCSCIGVTLTLLFLLTIPFHLLYIIFPPAAHDDALAVGEVSNLDDSQQGLFEKHKSWIIFAFHVIVSSIFLFHTIFGLSCLENCTCLQVPYRNIHQPANVEKCLRKIGHSKRLTKLQEGSEEFEEVKSLMNDTWCYDERKGRDSNGLNHDGIEAKFIYRVNKPPKVKKFDAVSSITKLPEALKDTPIKTEIAPSKPNARSYEPQCNKPVYDEVKPSDPLLKNPNQNDDYSQHGFAMENVPSTPINSTNHVVINMEETNKVKEEENVQKDTDHMDKGIDHRPLEHDHLLSSPSNNESKSNIWQLFHGTGIENIMLIVKHGFDLSKAQKGLFGRGVYLAESSEKADQYTDNREPERRMDNLTMLLVHVKPGEVKTFSTEESGHTKWWQKRGPFKKFKTNTETIVAGSRMRFREFLVKETHRCVPTYVIVYNRVRKS